MSRWVPTGRTRATHLCAPRSFDAAFGLAQDRGERPEGAEPRLGAASLGLRRLVDANANRALEGLRVCEELGRFVLQSPRAFASIRALRHATALALRRLPLGARELLEARDSARDLGRRAPSDPVESAERLLVINFQRAKEALRTLEECARVLAPRQAARFQRLRFDAYDAERTCLLAVAALRDP